MNYIQIFGPIRAGKTLVGRALNMHPKISLQQEPYFFFFKICRNIYFRDILKVQYDSDKPMGLEYFNSVEQSDEFSQSFSNLFFNELDIKELIMKTKWQQKTAGPERAPKILPHLNNLKPGTAKEVFIQLMKILTEAYKKKSLTHVGCTEAWCDNYGNILQNIFSDNFFCINSLRDPRAVIASRNHGPNIKEKYGGKYPILGLIRHWRNNVMNSIINESNHQYLTVRYEDIVSYPDLWFKNICDFLGLEFFDVILDVKNYVNGQGEVWKQNTSFKAGNGFSNKSVEKWKNVLSNEEIGLIEYLCKPELEYLNYEFSENKFSVNDVEAYNENPNEFVDWLKSYSLHITKDEISKEIARIDYFYGAQELDNDKIKTYFYNEMVYKRLKSSEWEHQS